MTTANKIQIGLLSAIAILLLYLVFTGGFGGSSSDSDVRDAARANLSQNNVANSATKKAPETPPKPVGPTTTMSFAEKKFDFGNVDSGEDVTHVFKFKNTGKEPLVISNAKGSCGCTVPEWPKEPIAPGKDGEIKVKFNSKAPGKQTKNVTITANTDPVTTTLHITADVAKDPNAPAPTPNVTPSVTPVPAPATGK